MENRKWKIKNSKWQITLFIILLAILTMPSYLIFAQDDLGVKDVGLLPTSPFYFLKDWIRDIEKVFTLNPIKKIELESDIANERLAEIKKLEEVAPKNTEAIGKAILKYQKNISQLKTRLKELKETSENPNIDKLLNKFIDQSFKHQQLFDELKAKFEDQKDLVWNLWQAQEKNFDIQRVIVEKIDTIEKFKERVENVVLRQKDEFKELKAAEFIDRLEEKIEEKITQKELANLKEDLLLKFSAHLESRQLIGVETSSFKDLLGDQLRRLKLLDEVREKVVNPELKSELNIARQGILENVKEAGLINSEDVKIRIEKTDQLIQEIEKLIGDREGEVSVSIKQLLERAKFNLESAKNAFEAGNFGNAFGQATAAGAAANNAYKQLTTTTEDYQNIINELKKRFDALNIGRENPRIYNLLNNAEKQILELSQLAAKKAAPDKINILIQNIKLALSTIENFLTEK
jgi:hypothetical protein